MTVFVAFLVGMFVVAARATTRGRQPRLIWLVLGSTAVAATFYSLRVV